MTDMLSLIRKKRDKQKLKPNEIKFFVKGVTDNSIPDYQISSFLMATLLNGMDDEETFHLTKEMMNSGDILDLSCIDGFSCDKHSTGGVGDKITMIIAPIAASLGVKVPMYSGKGLGHTGGTIDKLDSIPGFKTELSEKEFINSLEKIGIANSMQSKSIAPADKKLYALRDVTGTVESIPLITGSIMSKKLACGANGLVLDVKCGKGAFMKDVKSAEKLAKSLIRMGKIRNIKISAIIDSMDTPLGYAIGNSMEMIEVIEILKGKQIDDLLEVSKVIVCEMLKLRGKDNDFEKLFDNAITSGKALEKLREWVKFSGGNCDVIDNYDIFPQCAHFIEVKSLNDGFVNDIDSLSLGMASVYLGAGRQSKDDVLDYGAGIMLKVKKGDKVAKGMTMATLYYNDIKKELSEIENMVESAFKISNLKVEKEKRIIKIIK